MHHDNAIMSHFVRTGVFNLFRPIAKNFTNMIEQVLYLPDMAPCNFLGTQTQITLLWQTF